ncbi:hypothetical protein FH972_009340 [Carpinus fangiana]|uniref:AAA+ ATPase domain-containing protein n=1 Tax=Carpinus fangiana TaxID=176857 RepID=A0A5N6R2G8_9ROSI|nr:hypothetical protein FH972_009340 [Carpinus fangiana]
MLSQTMMPSASSVLSTYTSFAASAMLVRTMINEDSEYYLSTRITSSIGQHKVSRTPSEKNLSITINKGEKIIDIFEGIHFTWKFVSDEKKKSYYDSERGSQATETTKSRSIRLSFPKKYMEKAMDPKQKSELMDDLDRFVKRKEFYRRVGKAWKCGYLLYGPPGTGKSSLIAAMANYLKFDVFDLELTNIRNNSELRTLLTSTKNRSILVIEDIDCSIKLKDRQYEEFDRSNSQLTLSGLLNFIDGLWSSCGDERIIVFTTNYKDKIDPALIRTHCLFAEIEGLLNELEVTLAEVAEELMKSNDADIALMGLVAFLQQKKKKKVMTCTVESKLEGEVKELTRETKPEEGVGGRK